MAVSLGATRAREPRSREPRRAGPRLTGVAPRRARAGVGVDSITLGVCVALAVIAVALPGVMRDRIATELRRTVAAPLAVLERWSELRRAAFLSYDDRMQAQAAVTHEAQEAAALRSENARLRALLGLGARLGWGFVTAEAVPNQQAGELGSAQTLQQFKVTVGSRAGVAAFTPVVAPEGLVGMVQQVDPVGSQVISYAHPDFRVSAQTPDDSAFGIVQPHLGPGSGRGLLELRGVPFRSPLKAGQLIVSSGLGGTYPRGIPIGTVIREIQTPEKWARTYLLQPAVNLGDVGPVMLLLRPRADRGVDSVWTSVKSAEVVARRIATAGDSLARDELLREAAARRTALDSTRADSARADSTAHRDSAGGRPAGERAPAATVPPPTPRPSTRPRGDSTADGANGDASAPHRAAPPAAPRASDSAPRPVPHPTVPRPTVPAPIAAGAHAASHGAAARAGARPPTHAGAAPRGRDTGTAKGGT